MVDIPSVLGVVIIIVGVITLIRIIKPLLEGIIIVVVIVIGSLLLFHSAPIIGLPNFHMPVSTGLNIFDAQPGNGNTTDVIVFNAYTFSLDSFTATLNNKSVRVLDKNLVIPPLKFGVLILNSTGKGVITLQGMTNILGFNLGSMTAEYNYT